MSKVTNGRYVTSEGIKFHVGDFVVLRPDAEQIAHNGMLPRNCAYRIAKLDSHSAMFFLEREGATCFGAWAFINLGKNISPLEKAIYGLAE